MHPRSEGAFGDSIMKGLCVWLTGLSGAGKTTIAGHLRRMLVEKTGKYVSLMDGDEVRRGLSSDLGFSKEDRTQHALRVAYVCSQIVKHGGLVIAALITPYQETRDKVRDIIGAECHMEVFVDTPLDECERRDPKGLYKKARAGEIKQFTGLDDPYEEPECADLTLKWIARGQDPGHAALRIVEHIKKRKIHDVLGGEWCL